MWARVGECLAYIMRHTRLVLNGYWTMLVLLLVILEVGGIRTPTGHRATVTSYLLLYSTPTQLPLIKKI